MSRKHNERAVGVDRTVCVYDWPYDRFVIIKEFSDGNCCICLDTNEPDPKAIVSVANCSDANQGAVTTRGN
jgi:hypothetical protein